MNSRVMLGHISQPGCHQQGPGPRTQTHPETAQTPLLQQSRPLFEFLRLVHDAPGPLQHRQTQGRQFILFTHPVHQWPPQFLFEHLNTATERRLGDKQFFGSATEGPGLSQSQPMGEVLEVHVFILRMKIIKISHLTHKYEIFNMNTGF